MPAPPRARDYQRALVEGQLRALEMVRAGVAVADVFRAAQAEVVKTIPHYRRNHIGHGIGIEVYDPPSLRLDSTEILEAGMVINVENCYYEVGFAGFQVEDTVLVTETGCEVFTTLPRELIEL